MFDKATQQMSTSQTNLAKSQAQLAQGKQVINPSDAPDQAATIQRLKSIMARQTSYQSTLNSVQTRLQEEDSTLQSVNDLLIRAKEVAVQAANDTLSPTNRKALGVELQGLRDQILSLANSKDSSGNYIVKVGENRSMLINRSGTDVFAPVSRQQEDGTVQGVGFFNSLDDLIKGVNTADPKMIQGGVGEMDKLLEGVTFAQANIGSGLKGVEQQNSVIDDTVLNLTTTLSSFEDLDYTSAITKMNQQMMSLEAAQSSFAKISQLNLFNFIK
jgi:flagellar hook-associated protein 3 FlgL